MEKRVDVFSDGSVSLISDAKGMKIQAFKTTVGAPVTSEAVSDKDFNTLIDADGVKLKFDIDKREMHIDKRRIVVNLKKKDDRDNNDDIIAEQAPTNVSADTRPSPAKVDGGYSDWDGRKRDQVHEQDM